MGLLSTLVPGAGLLSPLITGLVGATAIASAVGILYVSGRHAGVMAERAANAAQLIALNFRVDDDNRNAEIMRREIDAFTHRDTTAVKETPHTFCIPPAVVDASLNAITERK